MLEDTLTTFQKGGEVSAAQGVMLIDGWLQALQGDPNLDQLESQLTELRAELQSGQPNSGHIGQLLENLAHQAQQAAEEPTAEGTWTGGLESLAKILRGLRSKL